MLFRSTFTPLWGAQNGFKIKVIGDHKILFSFEKEEDVDRIMNSEPWSFDKHLVVMHRYENDGPLQEIKFIGLFFGCRSMESQ